MRALLATLLLAGSAHANLLPRDLNGDGTVDAYFDPAWNISYLADANIAGTLGYTSGPSYDIGQIDYYSAIAFGGTLDVFGVRGWRLPYTEVGAYCKARIDELQVPHCTGDSPAASELGRLAGQTNLFRNQRGPYFTSGHYEVRGILEGLGGGQFLADEANAYPQFAEFVRDGDVSAVPEPGTWALLLLGLHVIARQRRRQDREGAGSRRSGQRLPASRSSACA